MAKRKLSNRQKTRIDERQQQHVERLEPEAARDATKNLGPRSSGLVTCNFGQQLEVEAIGGTLQGKIFRCFQRSNLPAMVSGDRIIFQSDGESSGVIVALDDRRNVFSRPASSGELRPVASNIDLVLIVIAPIPQPFMNLVDRYLVAVESLQLTPLLIINKADLMASSRTPELDAMGVLYAGLGYKVIEVSATTGAGITDLKKALNNKTAVIVGQSGVGKSSLINALSPQIDAPVGALSRGSAKGTHTTTSARLFHLDGCDLIDSPGIREFGLWHISPHQLLEGFTEFRPFVGQCKFRDCSHRNEPQCALRSAVESGAISSVRLESYFHILESLANL
ncbi:MAG: small ribosomal subunit biogenesis GTPase RsgA [Gammaproteobacteria bacterium]|nr:small ribosomal subunit biogenesis GTPase RsgA [Gammaproteobacteria bacterium]